MKYYLVYKTHSTETFPTGCMGRLLPVETQKLARPQIYPHTGPHTDTNLPITASRGHTENVCHESQTSSLSDGPRQWFRPVSGESPSPWLKEKSQRDEVNREAQTPNSSVRAPCQQVLRTCSINNAISVSETLPVTEQEYILYVYK